MHLFLLLLFIFVWITLARQSSPKSDRYRRQPARLRPRSRRKPAWVRHEIIRLKALSDLSCYKLADTFNRMYAAQRHVTVGKTWVADVVRTHRYEIAELRRHYKRRVPPQQRINTTWGLDFTGKADTVKTVYPIFGVLDHGSRMALCLQPLANRTAVTTLKALLAVIETYGTPRIVRTDNDAVFTSRLFRFGLRWLGIRHRLSAPGSPWQNGRIERLFGTLKEKLNHLAVLDLNDLDRAIGQFRFWYNAVRPHQHLYGWTPLNAWQGQDPYGKAPKSAQRFDAWEGLLTGVYLRW